MGLLDNQTQKQYYQGTDYGNYQFITLNDIIDQFTINYIGEGKIISKIKRVDVAFHAQRALQELSYDTLKSVKSQEIEVCANLKVPLPQDYVNYVKLTRVDSAGIEHVIYPISKTSHPFAVEQTQTDCTDCGDTSATYQYGKTVDGITDESVLKPQEEDCGTLDVTCTMSLAHNAYPGANQIGQNLEHGGPLRSILNGDPAAIRNYWKNWTDNIDDYCNCLQNSGAIDNCGVKDGNWDNFHAEVQSFVYTANVERGVAITNFGGKFAQKSPWSNLSSTPTSTSTITKNIGIAGGWESITTTTTVSGETSDAWTNYKGSTPSENQDDYNDDTYWPLDGSRYGLDPQYAHGNGSFFIDNLRGVMHFSSNISGKTIILKYISDSLGTDEEMMVHKFAEEAMYKWIAYGILSARADTPEFLVSRFKKERFAETRKAKIRLSNLKIEELTQILRGKSKQIKH